MCGIEWYPAVLSTNMFDPVQCDTHCETTSTVVLELVSTSKGTKYLWFWENVDINQ